MPPEESAKEPKPDPHGQMLKLVAKGFYRELINYGVKEAEVLTVAGHLLDNVALISAPAGKVQSAYNQLFTIKDVRDEWSTRQILQLQDVVLTPLSAERAGEVAAWLEVPKIHDSFFPRYPRAVDELKRYFLSPDSEYLAITYQGAFVGIIGAEHIDVASSKVEMRKLVGDPAMRGKGIGKRATLLFLYYVFVVRKFFKVYLHTLDINIRNLNLNGNFGFWLEGVFFEDVALDGRRQDLVRMALTAPVWERMFK
jgi:RimJ/RimL family protein N-acetyltransferase